MARVYWIDLFTAETWQEFLDHGGDVSGFSEKRQTVVAKIRPGDYLLCYMTRASRWVGLLEAAGEPFFDQAPIWSAQVFPCRIKVKALLALAPEHGVPVLNMREELSVFPGLSNPNHWQRPFRASPTRWKTADGEAIVRVLREAQSNPVERPLGRVGKGLRKVAARQTPDAVVIPGDDEAEIVEKPEGAVSAHTEIQYLLAKLGAQANGIHGITDHADGYGVVGENASSDGVAVRGIGGRVGVVGTGLDVGVEGVTGPGGTAGVDGTKVAWFVIN